MPVFVLQQPPYRLFVSFDHPLYVLQHRALAFIRLAHLHLADLEDALRQFRWFELSHRQVEQR